MKPILDRETGHSLAVISNDRDRIRFRSSKGSGLIAPSIRSKPFRGVIQRVAALDVNPLDQISRTTRFGTSDPAITSEAVPREDYSVDEAGHDIETASKETPEEVNGSATTSETTNFGPSDADARSIPNFNQRLRTSATLLATPRREPPHLPSPPADAEPLCHSRQLKNGTWVLSGTCLGCGKWYRRLFHHIKHHHKEDFTPSQAARYGLQICSCGTICRSLRHHWPTKCPLPPSERKQKQANPEPLAVTPPCSPPPQRTHDPSPHPIQMLYTTLADDSATEEEITRAFEILADLPAVTRVWRPSEVKLLNTKTTELCNGYVAFSRKVDLLRLLALVKVGASPTVTHNRLGRLRQRLSAYPKLSDWRELSCCLENRANNSGSLPEVSSQVHKKLTQARLGAAARLLEDNLGLAAIDSNTLEKLVALHPDEEPHQWPQPQERGPLLQREDVLHVLRRVSRETAGGPSGLDGNFVWAVRHNTAFVDLLLLLARQISSGTQELPSLFLSARVVPLKKNLRGDVRPIAVTELLYRLASKVILKRTPTSLLPCQFGVGSPGGVEPLAHLMSIKGHNHSLVSVDLKNAFNSMRRDWLLQEVRKRAPRLLRTYIWAYKQHTPLYLGKGLKLSSRSGVRQGDPLGPLLFSIGFAPILEEIKRVFDAQGLQYSSPVWSYLDDTYLIVRETHAKRALHLVADVFTKNVTTSGLQLRPEKTWMCNPSTFRKTGVDVLGTHIGGGVEKFLDLALGKWKVLVDKLHLLTLQDANLLLRGCLLPRLGHLYRTLDVTPTAWKQADKVLDMIVRGWLTRFELEGWDPRLASLPLRMGGLGLTRPSIIAATAFDASRDESLEMVTRVDETQVLAQPSGQQGPQRARVKEIWIALQDDVIKDMRPDERRVFQDNSSVVGTKWLHAFPADPTLTFSDSDFAAAVAHRLLLQGKHCRSCRRVVEDFGHPFHCPSTRGLRLPRHELVKQALGKAFQDCGADVTVEPGARQHHRRADLLVNGEVVQGRAAFDISLVATTGAAAAQVVAATNTNTSPVETTELISEARRQLQQILTMRHEKKLRENANLDFGGVFTPWIVSIGGTFHRETWKTLRRLKEIGPREHEKLMFDLSVILAKARARCFQRVFVPRRMREESVV